MDDNPRVSFDPHRGFILSNATKEDEGQYICLIDSLDVQMLFIQLSMKTG